MGKDFVSFLIIFPQYCHGLSTQCNNYIEVVFIPGADGRTLVSVNPPKGHSFEGFTNCGGQGLNLLKLTSLSD